MGTQISGVVLAAGRSSRMGRDKALLVHDQQPMWRRQRDVLVRAGSTEVFLSARPDQEWTCDTDGFSGLLHDAQPDCGPIIGLTAALERMSHSHLAVLAIDLPEMPADWFTQLMPQCGQGVGCVGVREEYFEPLAAVYPCELKWLAWETVARGEYSLQVLLRDAEAKGLMRRHEIAANQLPWFRNWNEER